MANKLKNEMEIKLAGEVFLLQPNFNNVQNLENSPVGGIPKLGFEMSKGRLLTLNEIAWVVYHCHEPKKFTVDEIWEMVRHEGISCQPAVYQFLTNITAGDKTQVELTENQKKN